MASWRGVLGGLAPIAGAVLAPMTGGASIPIGAAVGGALREKPSYTTPPFNPNATIGGGGGGEMDAISRAMLGFEASGGTSGLSGLLASGGGAGGWGGLLQGLLQSAAPVGAAATGAAAGQASERGQQNLYNINRNNAQTSRYGIQQGALNDLLGMQERGTMDRAGLKLAAPSQRASQVVKGSLMELLQPAKISHPRAVIPEMSGGLTPAALSGAVRQSGRDLQQQAGDALRTGSDIPAMPDFKKEGLLPQPDITEYEKPSGLETTLGTTGSIASLIAALAKQGQGNPNKPKITTPQGGQPVPPPPPGEMDPITRAALGLGR